MDLSDSATVGSLSVPNRGVFRPVRTRFVDDGRPTEELAAHLAARAAGGAGLVVGPAEMLVHSSASGPAFIDAYDDEAVPALTSVADAVHDQDAKIVGQLTHTGAESRGDWEMQPQLAPSASPSDAAYEMPKTMTRDDIEEVLSGFAEAAANLDAAGFDGVELAAGPFSVLRQFLSPRYNARDDEYGGDWSSRARFVNEALDTVAGQIEGPVGLHLSLAELEYGGYEFDDVPEILNALDGFDYLSCTVGSHATYNQTHAGISSDAPDLVGPIATAAETVDVPVIGRLPFTTVDDADTLFDAGAELVSFTRQLLADAETLRKDEAGEGYDRCIQCNQKCLEAVYGHAHGGHVECVVNPRTGRESELSARSALDAAALPQRVLVIGGGPAGLRFAAIAAERGHDVTLREASDSLGGQLTLAAQGPLAPFERAAADLETAAREAGVTVELDSPVTADDVGPSWDAVVVATGATRPETGDRFDGSVVNAFDVLEGADVGEDVLLFDENRWIVTAQTGLELLGRGASVEMVSSDHYPAFRTEQPNLPGFVAALQAQGAEFTGNHTVDSVAEDGTATLRNTLTGDTATRDPDTVVVAGRRQADESLYLELDERRDDVYRIGDAVSPRKLDRAYYDGELLARRL
ncbi:MULTISPECIES: oxidoreductase [Halolamina]|uniref:2,4-dienoyl-CoA reductase n=1 Tax=Halolamina pelagica TaxID=699431 RepID=A0A1I5T443_9EURY|nr:MULTISPECIES: FAD-dependent oxidoreductase [Halolamina]NHX37469.1 FAD-dependent oxidoreductase [Halolamina sp. R1-12]SFP77789.1 2,4-dienoyl-CoA reductase [Halolamina pelagica]